MCVTVYHIPNTIVRCNEKQNQYSINNDNAPKSYHPLTPKYLWVQFGFKISLYAPKLVSNTQYSKTCSNYYETHSLNYQWIDN